jgi:hypothetical protein
MIQVKINWAANLPPELPTGYKIYQDDAEAGTATGTEFIIPDVSPGMHKYEISAVNILGEGPRSDAISIAIPTGLPSKVLNVTVNVSVSVSTNL